MVAKLKKQLVELLLSSFLFVEVQLHLFEQELLKQQVYVVLWSSLQKMLSLKMQKLTIVIFDPLKARQESLHLDYIKPNEVVFAS